MRRPLALNAGLLALSLATTIALVSCGGGAPPEARSSPASAFDTLTSALYIFGGAAETEMADLWTLRVE